MTNFNGMGPNNQGPMTGRGMGLCDNGIAGVVRRGRGVLDRGRCCDYVSSMPYQSTKEDYKKILQEEIEDLQAELKGLEE